MDRTEWLRKLEDEALEFQIRAHEFVAEVSNSDSAMTDVVGANAKMMEATARLLKTARSGPAQIVELELEIF